MPAIKKPVAKAVASGAKVGSAKAKPKKPEPKPLGPAYVDPKIDGLVNRFEKVMKAMTADAVKVVKDYHAGTLVVAPRLDTPSLSFDDAVSPLLWLADYAKLHCELVKLLERHKSAPTKRVEKLIVDQREKLLDLLNYWDIEPLWKAVLTAPTRAAQKKAYRPYREASEELRRVRLGLDKVEFKKLQRKEAARNKAYLAEKKVDWSVQEAAEVKAKPRAKAKAEGRALV